MISPQKSVDFVLKVQADAARVIKRKFNNLSVEETIALATEIANCAHAHMLRVLIEEHDESLQR